MHPLEGSCQEAIRPLYTTFEPVLSVVFRLAHATLDVWLQMRLHTRCHGVALVLQAVQNGQTAGDGQAGLGLWQQAFDLVQGQRVHPLGTETPARMPPDDVRQPARAVRAEV
jgi:hypothetical protein